MSSASVTSIALLLFLGCGGSTSGLSTGGGGSGDGGSGDGGSSAGKGGKPGTGSAGASTSAGAAGAEEAGAAGESSLPPAENHSAVSFVGAGAVSSGKKFVLIGSVGETLGGTVSSKRAESEKYILIPGVIAAGSP